MKCTKTSSATIVEPEKQSIIEIFTDFKIIYDDIATNNIILNLSHLENINNKNLSLFSKLIKKHKKNKKSFVLIVNETYLNKLSDEITAAPTLTEAKDLVEMEEIERDLGF
ncbi:MAG: ribonuclease Z [Flavobacteriales bacterium]|nr:MAG: ribonuclease Z [Flavobacteriales bacterium]